MQFSQIIPYLFVFLFYKIPISPTPPPPSPETGNLSLKLGLKEDIDYTIVPHQFYYRVFCWWGVHFGQRSDSFTHSPVFVLLSSGFCLVLALVARVCYCLFFFLFFFLSCFCFFVGSFRLFDSWLVPSPRYSSKFSLFHSPSTRHPFRFGGGPHIKRQIVMSGSLAMPRIEIYPLTINVSGVGSKIKCTVLGEGDRVVSIKK